MTLGQAIDACRRSRSKFQKAVLPYLEELREFQESLTIPVVSGNQVGRFAFDVKVFDDIPVRIRSLNAINALVISESRRAASVEVTAISPYFRALTPKQRKNPPRYRIVAPGASRPSPEAVTEIKVV